MDIYKMYGGDGGIKEYSPWHGFSAGDIFNPQSAFNTSIAANNAAAQARIAAQNAAVQAAQWNAVQSAVSIPNGQALAAQARANLANQQNNAGQAPYGYTQPGYSSQPSAGNPGYAIDPNTGYYIDPVTGLDINPQTGQDIPASQGTTPYGGGYYPTPPVSGSYAVYPAQPGYQPNPYPTY